MHSGNKVRKRFDKHINPGFLKLFFFNFKYIFRKSYLNQTKCPKFSYKCRFFVNILKTITKQWLLTF